jgi:MFS transporter, DHA1 family, multidrug resistance protein
MRKDLLFCTIAGFNTALSFTLVASFLPIYLDSLGISLTNIGIVFAFGAMLAGIIRFPIGTMADKIGRRPLMLFGAIGYPLFALGVVLSRETSHFLGLKLLIEGFGALFWTAFWAYIYDVIRRGHEGREIAYTRILLGASGAIAPFIGGMLIAYYGFAHLFYLAAVIGIINIFFVAMIIHDKTVAKHESVKQFKKDVAEEYKHIIHIKKFRIYLTISILHNITWAIWWVYMPIYLVKEGVTIQQVGMIISILYIVYMITSYPLGKLIDIVPSKYLIIPGFLLVWLSGYIFLAVKDFAWLAISRAGMGVGFDLRWEPLTARLSHLTPKSEHGGTVGLFRAGGAIAVGITTVVAGYLCEIYTIKTVLFGASTFSLIIGLGLIFVNSGLKEKGRILHNKHHVMHLHKPRT